MRQALRAFLAAALAGLVLTCACARPAAEKPQPAPAVKLRLLQAPLAELDGWSGLRGKLVVVEFWATWCDSCVEEQPHLNALAEKFQGRPVQFLSVTADSESEVRKFLKTHRLAGWIGLDLDGAASEAFGVHGLPHTVILNAQGEVLGETYPELLTAERLEAMLAGAKS
ncbi:MAG: TlpA disulfide reductase family protein [Elusimicrobia bacterium]|nr:TlpA disulfide reductase family protein [Elusimicrobiota bacterium]